MSPYFKDFLFLTKMTMNLKERVQYLYMNAIHAQFFLCFLNRFPHYHRFHVPLSSIYLRIAFSVPQFQSPETLSLPLTPFLPHCSLPYMYLSISLEFLFAGSKAISLSNVFILLSLAFYCFYFHCLVFYS